MLIVRRWESRVLVKPIRMILLLFILFIPKHGSVYVRLRMNIILNAESDTLQEENKVNNN